MRGVALAERPTVRTTILFADPDHGPRAQLAAAMLRAGDEGGALDVSSAGTEPGGDLTGVVEVLAERGVHFDPQSLRLDLSMAPDLLILVCEEGCAACPYLPGAGRIVRWPFEDPAQLPADQRAAALRAMAARLEELAAELLDTRPGSA
jgi:protein-tyrosine-phosphatase